MGKRPASWRDTRRVARLGSVPCNLYLATPGKVHTRRVPHQGRRTTFSLCLIIVFLLQLAAGVLGFIFSDKFSCCGGISYDWSLNMYFNCSEDNSSREHCSGPYSCCLPTPNQAVINTMFICTHGCTDRLVNWIQSNLFILGGVALGPAIRQLVENLLFMNLVSQIKDQIKLQLYNQQHQADSWY
ncbi:hypothetical protein FD755_017994 [Muntiacus reevesi]|uniref:Tetraspanin n=1 Tax=Muntiacus reevesi TaxID=9886 RepID=A0A5N3X864_MUNRE|nr:hypothetical protein FD755_017994 [Muntiacus reevesi]